MHTIMRLLIAALILFPSLTLGHSMQPGFEVERTYEEIFNKSYELTNHYDFPAVYEVEVLNKDRTPAKGWKSDKVTYKLLPNSKRSINLKFKTEGKRKLLVCSTLTEVGKNDEKASIISRVCSRLIIHSLR
jgi:hypothetical protein